jgi:pimeloyl-ACP methyl ester carboxylesterase
VRLAGIDCPVLLAQGGADWIAAGQTVRFLAEVPGARFRLLPFAGHAAQEDVPALVARLVRDTAARSLGRVRVDGRQVC